MLVLILVTHMKMDKQNLLTKLLVNYWPSVNEKITNWDEHLSIVLFSYKTTYKVVIKITPYQLVYGLHPLIPIEYVLLAISGDHKDVEPTRILIARIINLEQFQENILEA